MSFVPGKVFNQALRVCDPPYNVPGCGGDCECSNGK